MYFRLFIVTLEHFGHVSYKRFELLFDCHYRGITVDSYPSPLCCFRCWLHLHDYCSIYFNSNSNATDSTVLPLIPSPCRSLPGANHLILWRWASNTWIWYVKAPGASVTYLTVMVWWHLLNIDLAAMLRLDWIRLTCIWAESCCSRQFRRWRISWRTILTSMLV